MVYGNSYKFIENNDEKALKYKNMLEDISKYYHENHTNVYIKEIERRLDTYIAYEFSKTYGNKEYLIESNFDNNKNNIHQFQVILHSILLLLN